MANNIKLTILTILIPSIPERRRKLLKLKKELRRQFLPLKGSSLGKVRIICDASPSFLSGGLSIGLKRNHLLQQVRGKYLCFLDDDESIAPNYVESLLRLCNQGLDICTFRSMVKMEDYWALVDMRLLYQVNDQLSPEYTCRRPPWHMCPVKTVFAQLYQFEDKNNAEDFAWFEKVLTHCTTEAHTDKILFQYNHGKHSEADKITNSI